MELLIADNKKLIMEEQVVGAPFSVPAVLLLDEQNKVINKYSFPFATFGFKRSSSNQNTLKTGVRPNGGFEGIAGVFGEAGLYASVTEFPLEQDNGRNRFVLFSLEQGSSRKDDKVQIVNHYYYDVSYSRKICAQCRFYLN